MYLDFFFFVLYAALRGRFFFLPSNRVVEEKGWKGKQDLDDCQMTPGNIDFKVIQTHTGNDEKKYSFKYMNSISFDFLFVLFFIFPFFNYAFYWRKKILFIVEKNKYLNIYKRCINNFLKLLIDLLNIYIDD